MPEADYVFKPTPETRPFGQLIAHVALSQFATCSFLQGGPSPKAAEKEETPRSKAALIALLKESATFCNPVVNAMTDEGMVQLIKVGPNEGARGVLVAGLSIHGNEVRDYCRLLAVEGHRPAHHGPPEAGADEGRLIAAIDACHAVRGACAGSIWAVPDKVDLRLNGIVPPCASRSAACSTVSPASSRPPGSDTCPVW